MQQSNPDYHELLIGAGRDHRKRYCAQPHHPRTWQSSKVVTLDVNKAVNPDLWCDLNGHTPWHAAPYDPRNIGVTDQTTDTCLNPHTGQVIAGHHVDSVIQPHYPYGVLYYLVSDYWNEIHAYEVLEHLGRQGDAHAFFAQMSELWRLLKPGGYLVAEVPSRFSGNLWGDPGHSRAIVEETLVFLDQSQYQLQCDGPERNRTPMSDYRSIYKADFRCTDHHDNRAHLVFVLQAVKPSRWIGPALEVSPT